MRVVVKNGFDPETDFSTPIHTWCISMSFFHFRWNSLRAGHVSIRAQEKTSSLRKLFILVLKTHATPIPALFNQISSKFISISSKFISISSKFISLVKFISHCFIVFIWDSTSRLFWGHLKHSLRAGIPSKVKESTILDQKRMFHLGSCFLLRQKCILGRSLTPLGSLLQPSLRSRLQSRPSGG